MNKDKKNKKNDKNDKSKLYNILFFVIGIVFPIVGIVLYLIFRKKDKKRANWCSFGVTVGFAIIILACIAFLISALKSGKAGRIVVDKNQVVNKE